MAFDGNLIVIFFVASALANLGLVFFVMQLRQKSSVAARELEIETERRNTFATELHDARLKLESAHKDVQTAGEERVKAEQNASNALTQLEDVRQKLARTESDLRASRESEIQAKGEVENARQLLDKERELLSEAKQKLTEAFQSSASQALEGSNRQFLELAKQFFDKHDEKFNGDQNKRHEMIEGMIAPFKEKMDLYQVQLSQLEKDRQKSYQTVETELKRVMETHQVLSGETRALKDALKKPHIRGRWGEIQLKNCIDLAGMSEFADVVFQDVNDLEEGRRLIPDMTVRMPGGRLVVVDSKAPLDAFLAALEATTEEERTVQTARHGSQVKEHVRKLSSKSYHDHVSGSADFTVMFLPNESFLYAAIESEPDLVEFALQKKILIATPPTFIGLLKVIRYGWNEERLARNAEEISAAGQELHKRLVDFVDAFEGIGVHLEKARKEFESGRSRLNSRVIVQARKMEALGVRSAKELPEDMGYQRGELLVGA